MKLKIEDHPTAKQYRQKKSKKELAEPRLLDGAWLRQIALDCGADEVIPDTIESSMMLARHTLVALGESIETISDMLDEAREGHYARIRAYFHSIDDIDLQTPDNHHLHSVEVLSSYHAIGTPIGELELPQQISVIGLHRNGVTSDSPLPEVELKAGDVLIIRGTPDDIQAAEIEVMSGL